MTFEEQMKEKFRDLAQNFELQISDFQVDHFFDPDRVRFTIRGGGRRRPREVHEEMKQINNVKMIKGGDD